MIYYIIIYYSTLYKTHTAAPAGNPGSRNRPGQTVMLIVCIIAIVIDAIYSSIVISR